MNTNLLVLKYTSYTHVHTHIHTTHRHIYTHSDIHTPLTHKQLHIGRLWIPMYVCSYTVLVNTETQTGIIHRYTLEPTQVASTQTQVRGQGVTVLV